MAIAGFGEIAEQLRRSTVLIHAGGRGSGSGVIWSSDGTIVTNAHVVRGSNIRVQLWDGREFDATVTARDPRHDLAALRIGANFLPAASPTDSSQLRPGELAIAIGNPMGFVGALTTGVIHGAGGFDGQGLTAMASAGGVKTVASHTGAITPFTMRVDQAPFHDVNVRQALRLLVDRQQLINSGLAGYGVVASDVFSPYDPDFDHSLHREADIPQAKFLLKKAGQEHLTVTLTTSPAATGMVSMATVLAEQAKAAGVTIKLSNVPSSTFFGKNYLSWTFSQDYYNYSPYLGQVAESMLPASPFNETHTNNATLNNLYKQANATLDESARKQIEYEMQQFDFSQGGYIIPAYIDSLDAYSTKITGYSTSAVGQPVSNFDFENWSFV